MNDSKLCVVDDKNNPVLESLLSPFWETILPAFQKKAKEIQIHSNRSNADDVSIQFQQNEQVTLLKQSKDFHPFVTSSRIRIILGVTVNVDSSQSGKMRVRFNEKIMNVNVRIETLDNFEILTLNPEWD
jgi:hypothetical protein